MTNETMDSTSDDRIKNNTMRHKYRVLSDIRYVGLKFTLPYGQGVRLVRQSEPVVRPDQPE